MIATASALVAGTVSLRLYGRYLTPEMFGMILVPLQMLSYLPLLDGGFRTVVNRQILANPGDPERLEAIKFCQAFYSWFALLALIVAEVTMIGYALTPAVARVGESATFFLALGLVSALSVSGAAQMSLLTALGCQAELFLLYTLNAWVTVGVLWLGLRLGAGVWSFPASAAAALFVTLPVAMALIRRRVFPIRFFSFRFDAEFRSYFERFRREALSCFRSEVATVLLFSVDIILVGLMCGHKEAAVYGILSRLFGIVRGFVQASGEAAWPLIAQHGLQNSSFGQQLIRINAWTYGSITGVACVVLYPFLQWFMGEQWIASKTVLYAVALRFLVTGMASNVAYLLYGLGQFHDLRRNLERELCASVVLAVALGAAFGVNGVSVAFLAATSFGTLFPMIQVFAKQVAMPAWKLMGDMWWRALAALVSAGFTAVLMSYFSSGIQLVGIGLVAFLAAVTLGYSISFLRFRGDSEGPLLRQRVFFYLKNM